MIALIDATRDEYGFGASEVGTWFHSSAFDLSVWEIWGCLVTGGRLVTVPYSVSREPDRSRDLLVAERVTVLSQSPSAFAQLLGVDHSDVSARFVVFGGEPLDARMLLPATVTAPDTLPLTANGKLDAAKLPAPAVLRQPYEGVIPSGDARRTRAGRSAPAAVGTAGAAVRHGLTAGASAVAALLRGARGEPGAGSGIGRGWRRVRIAGRTPPPPGPVDGPGAGRRASAGPGVSSSRR